MDLGDCLYIQIHQRYVGDDLPVVPEKPPGGERGGKQCSPGFLGRKGFDLDIVRINMLESREKEEKN